MIQFGDVYLGLQEREAVLRVLDSGRLTRGPVCREFEADLATVTHQQCHVVSSGTAALHVALLACGVQPGDEVIVPATTFVASANAVLYCGAKPVIVGIHSDSWTMTPEHVEGAVTEKTTAVVPVHLYGTPAPSLQSWRDNHYRRTGRRIAIVEDAAESLGCLRSGVPPAGDATAHSFYASKAITTGEGGAVGWNDPMIGRRVSHLSGQAQVDRYEHDTLGFNYRMTELQAAIGVEQLRRLPQFLAARRHVFDWYREYLPSGWRTQSTSKDDTSSCWAFAAWKHGVDAKTLIRRMHQAGVECRPIFPPLSQQPHVFAACESVHWCQHAIDLHAYGIVLPTHPQLTRTDVEKVCITLQRCAA